MRRVFAIILLTLCLTFYANVADADAPDTISILSANVGKLHSPRRLDVSLRLQDLCGSHGSSCDIWCAQSTFGGRGLSKNAVCRVIYRCADGTTRSVEAARDEPILMRCPARSNEAN